MKNVLIIGGLGFIGFNIAKKLSNNFKVFIIDALINYIPNNYKAWSYYISYRQEKLKKLNIPIFIENIKNSNFKNILTNINPDIIINAASMPVALLADINPFNAKEDIFDSHFQVLEYIRASTLKIDRYVYISSSMVYGNFLRDNDGKIIPASEEQFCMPIDTYGALKLSNEILIKQYAYKYNIPYTIIRPSAVYGPTDCNLRVTEIFLRKGFENGKIELDNGGLHQLDFTYIDDLVEGINLSLTTHNAVNQTFNISYGQGRTIAELALVVKNIFPQVQIFSNDCKPFRPNRGSMNIEKAKELLSYKPKYTLEKGILEYYHFLKEHINNY